MRTEEGRKPSMACYGLLLRSGAPSGKEEMQGKPAQSKTPSQAVLLGTTVDHGTQVGSSVFESVRVLLVLARRSRLHIRTVRNRSTHFVETEPSPYRVAR